MATMGGWPGSTPGMGKPVRPVLQQYSESNWQDDRLTSALSASGKVKEEGRGFVLTFMKFLTHPDLLWQLNFLNPLKFGANFFTL